MKPIQFDESNCILARDSKLDIPTPAFKSEEKTGEYVSCWKPTFLERISILFGGKVWLSMKSYHNPPMPVLITGDKKQVLV